MLELLARCVVAVNLGFRSGREHCDNHHQPDKQESGVLCDVACARFQAVNLRVQDQSIVPLSSGVHLR
jgi:hypothetical protein